MFSCKKNWLDAKPDKSLVVPTNIADYQALLDNTGSLFTLAIGNYTDISTDDLYAPYSTFQIQYPIEKNTYIWAKNQLDGTQSQDWNIPYQQILPCNIILEGIKKIDVQDEAYKNVKGSALFFRAYNYYTLAQQFCKSFSLKSASNDLGLPLRLNPNVNDKVGRSTVSQTYEIIISDLKMAKELLPVKPLYKTRPSIPGVFAMLARTYLAMEDYRNAGLYADSCLQLYNTLLDYNSLNTGASRPIARFNVEVIQKWDTFAQLAYAAKVDSTLYDSFSSNDLRKVAFFNPITRGFKGSYNGSVIFFNGLATDEIYLIRAECYARNQETGKAMSDLNNLLMKRYVKGTFTPLVVKDSEEALRMILIERRKELCFRGLRWTDLRRLNTDPRFSKTLIRKLNGVDYTLPPNDPRYIFEIPSNEIDATGIQQNLR